MLLLCYGEGSPCQSCSLLHISSEHLTKTHHESWATHLISQEAHVAAQCAFAGP
jgi:hypothetical protein